MYKIGLDSGKVFHKILNLKNYILNVYSLIGIIEVLVFTSTQESKNKPEELLTLTENLDLSS